MNIDHFLLETYTLALRSLLKLRRNPVMIFFSLIMPIIWLLLFTQTFSRIVEMPAFQLSFGDLDYVAVFLPAVFIMTAIQSASQSGFTLVADIEHGTMSRLLSTPMYRISYLAGKMVADGLRIAAQALVLLLVALFLKFAFGWKIPFAGGFWGCLSMILLVAVFGVSFSGLSSAVAIRTRNTEATMMISFTLTFPLLFFSTAMMPEQLLPEGLVQYVAFNPVTHVASALRALVLQGFDGVLIAKAVGVCLLVGSVLHGFTLQAFLTKEY